MDWRFQPLMPHLVIATLAMLAIPHQSHAQSKALVNACFRTVSKLCHYEMKAAPLPQVRKAAEECVRAKYDQIAERCRFYIEQEFPEMKGYRP